MGKKFWFGYIAFFVFVFPLFFSYVGRFTWTPVMSTISLAIGFIGWIIFIRWTYLQTIGHPRKLQKSIRSMNMRGHLTKGTIESKIPLKRQKNDSEHIEIVVRFRNFTGTEVIHSFEITDSKPYLKRYEEGNDIDLRLDMQPHSPGVVIADAKAQFSWTFGVIATSFVIIYMIVTFAVHYFFFSNGEGWRFITLWHPWVTTPFFGLFLFGLTGGKLFHGRKKTEANLLLYGKRATATVHRADQTGVYINEQPQIKYVLQFTDDRGESHSVTLKKIVPLTHLHTISTGTQDILYLPEDPQKIMFVE